MDLNLNAERFTGKGYIDTYQKYRPAPPLAIIHQALNYLNKNPAETVLDLGCGTGISTMVWEKYALEIIGMDPSDAMIQTAKEKIRHKTIFRFLQGYANQTGLDSHAADIVSCSQAFHWMEPVSTLSEVNRILKPGGVLVIYDVMWPPSVNRRLENAYNLFFQKVENITQTLGEVIAHRWSKKEHPIRLTESNYFSFIKKAFYHKTVKFSKEQFIGIALSQGGMEALLKRGFSKEKIGLNTFVDTVKNIDDLVFGEMTYHYRVLFAIK